MIESPRSNAESFTPPGQFDPASVCAHEALLKAIEGPAIVDRATFARSHHLFVIQQEPHLSTQERDEVIERVASDVSGIDPNQASVQRARELLQRYHVMEVFFERHKNEDIHGIVETMLKNPR